MPADLRLSDFLFQAAQGVGRAADYAGKIGDKIYDAERVSQVNAGAVEIDRLFSEYGAQMADELWGAPGKGRGALGDLTEYQAKQKAWLQGKLTEISKRYTNPDAQKALLNYANQKDFELGEQVQTEYRKRKVDDAQTLDLQTADELMKSGDVEASAARLSVLFYGSANMGTWDGVSAQKLTTEALKNLYIRDNNEVADYEDSLIKGIQDGVKNPKQAEAEFSARLDKSIRIGRLAPEAKQQLMDGFKSSAVTSGVVGQGIVSMTGADGFIKSDGLLEAYRVVEKSGLGVTEAAVAKGKLREYFINGIAQEDSAKDQHDKPILEGISTRIKTATTSMDSASLVALKKELEIIPRTAPASLSRLVSAKAQEESPEGFTFLKSENRTAAMDAVDKALALIETKRKDQAKVEAGMMEDAEVVYIDTYYTAKQHTYEPSGDFVGDLRGLLKLESSLAYDLSVGGIGTTKGIEAAEKRLVEIRKVISDMDKASDVALTATRTANYQKLNGKIISFQQADAFYVADKNWDAYDKSFKDNIIGLYTELATTDVSIADYQKLQSDAAVMLKSYTTNLQKLDVEAKKKAKATFGDTISDSVEILVNTVNRYVETGKNPDDVFYSALTALDGWNGKIPGYYIEGNEEASSISKEVYTGVSSDIDAALKYGREYVVKGQKSAATTADDAANAAREAKANAIERQYYQLSGIMSRGEKLPFDVTVGDVTLKAGNPVTAEFLQSYVVANWDYLKNPGSKHDSIPTDMGRQPVASTARASLEKSLNSLLGEDKITLEDYNKAMGDFDDFVYGGEGGIPTDDAIRKQAQDVLTYYSTKKKPPLNMSLSGTGNTFNEQGVKLYVDLFNRKISGNVGNNMERRSALLAQAVKTGSVYFGYSSDNESLQKMMLAKDKNGKDLVGFSTIKVKVDAGGTVGEKGTLVSVSDVPGFKVDGQMYAFVPTEYKNGIFGGKNLVLAKVDDLGVATPLKYQLSAAEIKSGAEKATASVGSFLYTGKYTGLYDTTAMVNDKDLLHILGVNSPDATKETVFRAIAMAYGEYKSTLEDKSAGLSVKNRAQEKWEQIAKKVFGVGTDGWGYIMYDKVPDSRASDAVYLKYHLNEVMGVVRNNTIETMKSVSEFEAAKKERGLK